MPKLGDSQMHHVVYQLFRRSCSNGTYPSIRARIAPIRKVDHRSVLAYRAKAGGLAQTKLSSSDSACKTSGGPYIPIIATSHPNSTLLSGLARSYPRRYCAIQVCMDLERISGLLRTLSPRQEKVVRLYFGLGCERPHSAGEMAQEFGVSSHVISGILGGAKRRLAQVGLTPTQLKEAARCEAELRQPILSQVFAGSQEKVQRSQFQILTLRCGLRGETVRISTSCETKAGRLQPWTELVHATLS